MPSLATQPDALAPGAVFGRYRIGRFLGRGGMGAVYAAEQIDDGRSVALKVLAAGLDSPSDRERFLREGKTAASINHPSTVYVYRTEEIDGAPTIAMELVEGGTLEEKVEQQGPLPVPVAIHDILAVVDGLDAAHRKGILHRDVKPANCFVGRNGEVKVGDFGLSRPVDRTDEMRLTQTGLFLGTPVFSSPEQLMGEPLDLRADVYAVGATLYYLLSGKFPYESDNAVRLVAAVLGGAIIPLESRRSDLPPKLCALVTKCLARNPDDRFADYASLRDALVELQPAVAVTAPIGRRIAAGVVDFFALGMIISPLVLARGTDASNLATMTFQKSLITTLVALPVWLAWSGVLEGFFGWSPGKYAAGLRVQRDDGSMPGLSRGLLRAFVFWVMPSLLADCSWALSSGASTATRSVLPSIISFGWIVVLFARARQRNAYRGEHDRITGTRVVRRAAATAFHRSTVAESRSAADIVTSGARIGSYAVLDAAGPDANVALGYDQELGRSVWIRRCSADEPSVPDAERNAIRAGCLRWLGGQRSENGGWDAFAAVDGQPLTKRLGRAADWATVHHWLAGLAAELEARDAGTWGTQQLSVDNVWITADEEAIILPFSVGSGAKADSSEKLLQQVSAAVLSADERLLTRQTWPLRARSVLAGLAAASATPSAVRELLQTAADRTEGFTRRKRVWLWVGTFAPAFLFAGVMSGVMITAVHRQDELLKLMLLVDYVAGKPGRPVNVANRETAATYIATHFRQRIVDRAHQARLGDDPDIPVSGVTFISDKEWTRADSIVAAHPTVSPAQVAAANRLVDSTWHGSPPGVKSPAVIFIAIAPIVVFFFAAIFGVVTSLVARRGVILRVLGLEVVTTRGAPAPRWLLLWRQLVIWAGPLLLFVPVIVVANQMWRPMPIAMAVIGLILAPAGLYFGLKTPERSLAERLSGTLMVPE
jgi:uncharacterized RDD family membrane protein YckC